MQRPSATEAQERGEHGQRWVVVTTIQAPTAAMRALIDHCAGSWRVVVAGDSGTPDAWHDAGVDYLSLECQEQLFGELARRLPLRHYARKCLGYLYAAANGADCILETDDDNLPAAGFGALAPRAVRGRVVRARRGSDWINPYAWFGEPSIWARGIPLDAIREQGELTGTGAFACAVQQFLVDGEPDVDAVFRLVDHRRDVAFARDAAPLVLEPFTFAPYNSQNTLAFREAFATLWLPISATFRMTDIWRSLVAQAALWAHGGRIAFRAPTMRQERNAHDLMRDLGDEVPGMLHNHRIAQLLRDDVRDHGGDGSLGSTCERLWRVLAAHGIVGRDEPELYAAWRAALEATASPVLPARESRQPAAR